ncbi:MAG: hypothetical protein ACYDAY_03470 [Candidatus Dormibacteria bacterium]
MRNIPNLRALARIGLVLPLALAAGLTAGPVAAAPALAGITTITRINDPAAAAPGRFVLDSSLRRGYDYYRTNAGAPMVQPYDLDSMRPLSAPLDISAGSGIYDGPQGLIKVPAGAVDEASHRVFLSLFDQQTDETPEVAVLTEHPSGPPDLHVFSLGDTAVAPAGTAAQGSAVEGFFYFAQEKTLYVLLQLKTADAGSGGHAYDRVQVIALDASGSALKGLWSYEIDNCNLASHATNTGFGRSHHENAMYLPCNEQVNADASSASASSGAPFALRIDMPNPKDATTFQKSQYSIVGAYQDSVFDPELDRLHMLYQTGANSGVWTFDGQHRQFINNASTGENGTSPHGIDVSTGRLYIGSSHYLNVLDGRPTPPGQGLSFTQYGLGNNLADTMIEVDTLKRHVFYPEHDAKGFFWLVLQDSVPLAQQARVTNPDALTSQVQEDPRTTESNFAAQGSSYGFEALFVGGYTATVDNACGATQCNANNGNPLAHGARDIRMGDVDTVELSNDEAVAHALGAEADDATKSDFLNHTGPGGHWPYQEQPGGPAVQSFCTGESPVTTVTVAGAGPQGSFGGGSTTLCHFNNGDPGATASASAVSTVFDAGGLVTVGRATSSTTVLRDLKQGSVTRAVADAYNIVIGGAVNIAHIHAETAATAHGHTGTASATFSRTIEGVSAPGFSCTSQCDPAAVAAVINQNLPQRAQVTFPLPDGATPTSCSATNLTTGCVVAGSPGGYQAHIAKDSWQYLADNTQNADETHQLVAMQVAVFNDGVEFNRAILKFAGVTVQTHYAVVPNPVDDSGTVSLGGTVSRALGAILRSITTVIPGTHTDSVMIPAQFRDLIEKRILGFSLVGAAPAQVALMASTVWLLFAVPAYLAFRRVSLARGAAE